MNPAIKVGLFCIVGGIQMFVPLMQVRRYEDILRTGRPYQFRTAAVDPSDAFRGRYVALGFVGTVTTAAEGAALRSGGPAYVGLLEGPDGMARFGPLLGVPPSAGDYLRVEYAWGEDTNAHFRLPFDRFYMEESKAVKAEAAYGRLNRRGQTNVVTYARVRVKGGRGVIEDVFIGDRSLREIAAGSEP